jgi:hypothetical protein
MQPLNGYRASVTGTVSSPCSALRKVWVVASLVRGLRVALPTTPYDAKGLFKTAIRSDDPVLFLEHKSLLNTKGPVPEQEYYLPFGQAAVARAGQDITVVAVDMERGLLVPVVRDADSKSLIAQARAGKAAADDLRGGTFTITNLGMYEIDAFTPIINLPECAILGVGRIVARPVVVDEQAETVAVRKMMALSLTFDHRLVDGAPAARFLKRVKQFVEHCNG